MRQNELILDLCFLGSCAHPQQSPCISAARSQSSLGYGSPPGACIPGRPGCGQNACSTSVARLGCGPPPGAPGAFWHEGTERAGFLPGVVTKSRFLQGPPGSLRTAFSSSGTPWRLPPACTTEWMRRCTGWSSPRTVVSSSWSASRSWHRSRTGMTRSELQEEGSLVSVPSRPGWPRRPSHLHTASLGP